MDDGGVDWLALFALPAGPPRVADEAAAGVLVADDAEIGDGHASAVSDAESVDWIGAFHEEVLALEVYALVLAVPAQAPAAAEPHVVEGRLARMKPKRSWSLPHPSRRTAAQHLLAAAYMREAKSSKAARTAKDKASDIIMQVRETMDKEGFAKRNTCSVLVKKQGRVVGLTFRRSRHQSRGFTWGSMLEMAFTKVQRIADVARVWRCDRSVVRQVQHAVAGSYSVAQNLLLEKLLTFLRANPPAVFCTNLSWDETTEKLRLPAPGLSAEQTRTAVIVLISLTEYVLGYWTEATQQETCRFLQILRPPVPLISTAAECIQQGLFHMEFVKEMTDFENKVMELAPWVFVHFDRDGAFSNDRMIASYLQTLPDKVCFTDRACG